LKARDTPKFCPMIDLDGNRKVFDVSTSIRWEVLADVKVDDGTSVVAYVYRTRSGRWVSWITQTSHSLELYGFLTLDPPDQIAEISIAEASLFLTNPRRPMTEDEPRLTADLIDYLKRSNIDGDDPASDATGQALGSPDVSGGAHDESGFAFYDSLDGRVRSITLESSHLWEAPRGESNLARSKMYRTEDRKWIIVSIPDGSAPDDTPRRRPALKEVRVEGAIDWFFKHDLDIPSVLKEDLDRWNAEIDFARAIERMTGQNSRRLSIPPMNSSPIDGAEADDSAADRKDSAPDPDQFAGSLPPQVADDIADGDGPTGILGEPPHRPITLRFLPDNKTVALDGVSYVITTDSAYRNYKKIAESKCRITGLKLEEGRVDKALKRGLPREVYETIDSTGGRGGGYRLKPGYHVEVHDCP